MEKINAKWVQTRDLLSVYTYKPFPGSNPTRMMIKVARPLSHVRNRVHPYAFRYDGKWNWAVIQKAYAVYLRLNAKYPGEIGSWLREYCASGVLSSGSFSGGLRLSRNWGLAFVGSGTRFLANRNVFTVPFPYLNEPKLRKFGSHSVWCFPTEVQEIAQARRRFNNHLRGMYERN